MSADESGNRRSSRKLPSASPPSGAITCPPSSSGSPPSSSGFPGGAVAWGDVRDAIASVHNLEALLRSPRIGGKALGEVLPDFLGGVELLRRAFAASVGDVADEGLQVARGVLERSVSARLDQLEAAMRAAAASDLDARPRLALEQVVTRVATDLSAAADLLDLSERAFRAVPIELSMTELARASLRHGSPKTRHERDVTVGFARGDATDVILFADPHVLKRLVAFAVARVAAACPDAPDVTIRAACEPSVVRLRFAPGQEWSGERVPVRLAWRLDATDAVVDAAAEVVRIEPHFDGRVLELRVPRAGTS